MPYQGRKEAHLGLTSDFLHFRFTDKHFERSFAYSEGTGYLPNIGGEGNITPTRMFSIALNSWDVKWITWTHLAFLYVIVIKKFKCNFM
jgi:hypothetical protein